MLHNVCVALSFWLLSEEFVPLVVFAKLIIFERQIGPPETFLWATASIWCFWCMRNRALKTAEALHTCLWFWLPSLFLSYEAEGSELTTAMTVYIETVWDWAHRHCHRWWKGPWSPALTRGDIDTLGLLRWRKSLTLWCNHWCLTHEPEDNSAPIWTAPVKCG